MQPINYLPQQQPDIGARFLTGLQAGAALGQLQQQQQEREKAQKLQEQYAIDLEKVTKNPTAQSFGELALKYPGQREAILASGKYVTEAQQNTLFGDAAKIYNALNTGKPDAALSYATQKRDALKNSGRDFSDYEEVISAINTNPEAAKSAVGIIGASLDPKKWLEIHKAPSEISEAQGKAQKALAEGKFAEQLQVAGINEKTWNVKNLQSQINDRSARLNLDRQATAATVAEKMSSIEKNLNDIPTDTRKLINEAAVTAATSKQAANQFNDLAQKLDAEGGGYGAFSGATDFVKKVGGFEGGMTQLRQEYVRLRNTAAVKSLPAGAASDKDISMALEGFPSKNASASDLSSFLRGVAKLQDLDASVSNAKTDWLAQNNGVLTRAKGAFIAGDYSAKPGESFNDFSQRIASDVSKRYMKGSQSQLVEQIPTERSPAPMAGQQNIRSQADAILRGGR
ncbi:MAG: hypothetical protein IM336_02520 [Microcystis sp. M018S1]|uniref:hypothetical protein n=1 Tax=Microcystis sp. M018S1 TaxID=2771108 RepID=UPI00258268B1|nr:hypothetical protein [Microcystis sp. M018S1]MCA2929428.1 hypothetical protein [Microcystis sp. M018S1]